MKDHDDIDSPATLSVEQVQHEIDISNVPSTGAATQGADFQNLRNSVDSMSSVSNLSSTSSSTSLAEQPFTARFVAKVSSQTVTRNGEGPVFTLQTKSLADDDNRQWTVERTLEDFDQLQQALALSANPGFGLIMPPLPDEPNLNPSFANEKSRHQLGPNTRTLDNDEWFKDCWFLQEYLRLLLNHPVFGPNNIWEHFLCKREPPPRVKTRKSSNFIEKLTENIDQKSRISHKDCEEYFQKEKDWCTIYFMRIKQASEAFGSIVDVRTKLCGVLSHLSTALNLTVPGNQSNSTRKLMKFNNLFSIAIDDYRRGQEVVNYTDEATLGSCLNFWTRYIEAEKEMLLQRTGLLIEYEKSNRDLDKAKPNKKEAAEKSKIEAEKLFEDCSDIARQEIKRFHHERTSLMETAVRKYGEAQLLVNKDILQLLRISYENLKQFQL